MSKEEGDLSWWIGHDGDKLLKPQVETGILSYERQREADRAGAGWRLGVKKKNRGSKELEKKSCDFGENWEKALRSHGRRIRLSFSLEQEPV